MSSGQVLEIDRGAAQTLAVLKGDRTVLPCKFVGSVIEVMLHYNRRKPNSRNDIPPECGIMSEPGIFRRLRIDSVDDRLEPRRQGLHDIER